MFVTMQDIADRVGLSRPTVSLALAGKGTVSSQTRAFIRKVAVELGYRPHMSARATRQGRTQMVSLLLSTMRHRSDMPMGLFNGVDQALTDHDLHLTITRLPDERLVNEGFVPRILTELMCDGLLINYHASIPTKMVQLIEEYTLPSIWINSQRETDAVCPDDLGAGRMATRLLLEKGHRRIAYVDYVYHVVKSTRDFHYSREDRYQGYAQLMREVGLQPRMICDDPRKAGDIHEHYRAFPSIMKAVLQAPDAPTAVISYGASNMIREVAASCGKSIPQDLAILTFRAADEFLEMVVSRDSGIVIPQYQMGQVAVDMLLQKLESPGVCLPARRLPFTFEQGDST